MGEDAGQRSHMFKCRQTEGVGGRNKSQSLIIPLEFAKLALMGQ